VSTANPVPETIDLTGADATSTLKATSTPRLVKDAVTRLRAADGFSHARSMAFATALIFVQGVIALVGLASALGSSGLSTTIVRTLQQVVPGATGLVLDEAVKQAHQNGGAHRWLPLVLGTVGALVTGATLLGQTERAMNRLYGIERDRPSLKKYGRAFVLAITAGIVAVVAFAILMLGRGSTSGAPHDASDVVWALVRWPLGAALLAGSTALIFRYAPNRRQPSWSWLLSGALVAVALLVISTVGLDALFRLSTTFGKTYGPLAGIVAMLFWSFAASLSLLLGAAFAVQLEAVRAGVPQPRADDRRTEALPPREDRPAATVGAS
jgi:YihY family inner membrane protein